MASDYDQKRILAGALLVLFARDFLREHDTPRPAGLVQPILGPPAFGPPPYHARVAKAQVGRVRQLLNVGYRMAGVDGGALSGSLIPSAMTVVMEALAGFDVVSDVMES